MAAVAAGTTRTPALVEPLRKTTSLGRYTRMPQTEALLVKLSGMERTEIVRRAQIRDNSHPDFLPDECLLHLVRACRSDNSERHFEALYKLLSARVLRLLPRPERRGAKTTDMTAEAIRDDVFGRFEELLTSDRTAYCDALDFWEVMFEMALAGLLSTARKKAWGHENRTVPLESDEETGEPSREVEEAAAELLQASSSKIDDPDYRSRLNAAIDTLTPTHRRIIEMMRTGMLIHSTEPGQVTIAKTLGLSEKTIRNQRDRAYAILRGLLHEEDGK